MKGIKISGIALMAALAIFSCNNNKQKAEKNINRDAMLVENAKVKANTDAQSFVDEAAKGGLMEVELGRYAEQNASNPRVKNFGAMMARDHAGANEELNSIASGKNLTLPTGMDESLITKVNDLKKKTGADFDREYMKSMVEDHETDVEKFRNQSESGDDPALKSFATKILPVLIVHLDSARAIYNALEKNK